MRRGRRGVGGGRGAGGRSRAGEKGVPWVHQVVQRATFCKHASRGLGAPLVAARAPRGGVSRRIRSVLRRIFAVQEVRAAREAPNALSDNLPAGARRNLVRRPLGPPSRAHLCLRGPRCHRCRHLKRSSGPRRGARRPVSCALPIKKKCSTAPGWRPAHQRYLPAVAPPLCPLPRAAPPPSRAALARAVAVKADRARRAPLGRACPPPPRAGAGGRCTHRLQKGHFSAQKVRLRSQTDCEGATVAAVAVRHAPLRPTPRAHSPLPHVPVGGARGAHGPRGGARRARATRLRARGAARWRPFTFSAAACGAGRGGPTRPCRAGRAIARAGADGFAGGRQDGVSCRRGATRRRALRVGVGGVPFRQKQRDCIAPAPPRPAPQRAAAAQPATPALTPPSVLSS